MTKLAKLYDRLEALKEKEAALIEQINVERAAAVRKVEVTRIGTTGQYYYLTSGKRTVKVQKNRHYGWEVFEGRKKIWSDIRCSLYDLKVSMANGGI